MNPVLLQRTWLCIAFIAALSCSSFTAQNYPEILASKRDVLAAKTETRMVRIPKLPIEDYPLLAKFKRLQDVDFYYGGATDAKLWQLSKLNLTNLQQISLLDCPEITDDGMRAIANIASIRGLGLEGTSITDAGLDVVATKLTLTGVNVSNCSGVSRRGVQRLAVCPSLRELTFSADYWTQDQVGELIDSLQNVKWCGIVDPKKGLNVDILKAKGAAKGITIDVQPTGALQEMRKFREKKN